MALDLVRLASASAVLASNRFESDLSPGRNCARSSNPAGPASDRNIAIAVARRRGALGDDGLTVLLIEAKDATSNGRSSSSLRARARAR
jgi:hypothetical protein